MTLLVIHVARPVLLWSLHFVAVYALISAACAPRGLIETDVMRSVAAIVTAVAVLLILFWIVQDARRIRHLGDSAPERPLTVAAVWSAGISLLAVLANLWPIATLASCSG